MLSPARWIALSLTVPCVATAADSLATLDNLVLELVDILFGRNTVRDGDDQVRPLQHFLSVDRVVDEWLEDLAVEARSEGRVSFGREVHLGTESVALEVVKSRVALVDEPEMSAFILWDKGVHDLCHAIHDFGLGWHAVVFLHGAAVV